MLFFGPHRLLRWMCSGGVCDGGGVLCGGGSGVCGGSGIGAASGGDV